MRYAYKRNGDYIEESVSICSQNQLDVLLSLHRSLYLQPLTDDGTGDTKATSKFANLIIGRTYTPSSGEVNLLERIAKLEAYNDVRFCPSLSHVLTLLFFVFM